MAVEETKLIEIEMTEGKTEKVGEEDDSSKQNSNNSDVIVSNSMEAENTDEPMMVLDEITGLLTGPEDSIKDPETDPLLIVETPPELQSEISNEVDAETQTTEMEPESSLLNIKGLRMFELLYKDQLDGTHSLADAHIVCEDGHVPFHRYILMAASNLLKEILIHEDPSELAVIHIPDVKVANVVQVLCILYTGKALYKKVDEADIYKIFQMLGIGTEGLQFRNSKPDDGIIMGKLRFYEKEFELEEEDDFISNLNRSDSAEIETPVPVPIPSAEEAITEPPAPCCEEVPEVVTPSKRGPQVSSKSQIDKEETVRLMAFKKELEEDDSVIQTEFKIKCRYCQEVHSSEESLSAHLSSLCGSHLIGKYSYPNKQCLGCRRKFPSYSLFGLINHVESCKRLQVAFSATASQFVNGTLPPINIKEETDELYFPETTEATDIEGKIVNNLTVKPKRKKGKNRTKKRKNPTRLKHSIKIVDVSQIVEPLKLEEESIEDADCDTKMELSTMLTDVSDSSLLDTVSGLELDETDPNIEPLDEVEFEYVVENDPAKNYQNDVTKVPLKELQHLLTSCPVCKKLFVKLKAASKCLRSHGLRRCWICLKLLAANGEEFLRHNRKYHIIPGSDGKVECSFCQKEFSYNIGINTHMGNYHSRLLEPTTNEDNGPSTSKAPDDGPSTSKAALAELYKNNNNNIDATDKVPIDLLSTEKIEGVDSDCEVILVDDDDPDFVAGETIGGEDNAEDEEPPSGASSVSDCPIPQSNRFRNLAVTLKHCSVCKSDFISAEAATKCLRSHGLKRCWVCFELLSIKGDDFYKHNQSQHFIQGKPGRVACYICGKDYKYDNGMNLHIGKHVAFEEKRFKTPDSLNNFKGISSLSVSQNSSWSNDTAGPSGSKLRELLHAKRRKSVSFTATNSTITIETKERNEACFSNANNSAQDKPRPILPKKRPYIVEEVDFASTNGTTTGNPNGEYSGGVELGRTRSSSSSATVTKAAEKSDGEGKASDTPSGVKSDVNFVVPAAKAPNLGRVLLEIKEISGVIYNVYGLINPTSTDPKNKFSKVIAIPNVDVETKPTGSGSG